MDTMNRTRAEALCAGVLHTCRATEALAVGDSPLFHWHMTHAVECYARGGVATLAPPRRRPRRIAKKIAERHGSLRYMRRR